VALKEEVKRRCRRRRSPPLFPLPIPNPTYRVSPAPSQANSAMEPMLSLGCGRPGSGSYVVCCAASEKQNSHQHEIINLPRNKYHNLTSYPKLYVAPYHVHITAPSLARLNYIYFKVGVGNRASVPKPVFDRARTQTTHCVAVSCRCGRTEAPPLSRWLSQLAL
jgi:hypothetical protein